MRISNKGLELIKEFEGFRSQPYLCSAGVPTIGYGSTYYKDGRKVSLGDKAISKEEATELLEHTVNSFANGLKGKLEISLSQNQFDALVCLAYNIGLGAFSKSTLLKKINAKDFTSASSEFLKWDIANGKKLLGLRKRREREQQLFLQD